MRKNEIICYDFFRLIEICCISLILSEIAKVNGNAHDLPIFDEPPSK